MRRNSTQTKQNVTMPFSGLATKNIECRTLPNEQSVHRDENSAKGN